MLIDWIDAKAAQSLYSAIDNQPDSPRRLAMHLRTPQSAMPLDVDDVVRCIYPPLRNHHAAVYMFEDEELFITWQDAPPAEGEPDTYEALRHAVYDFFKLERSVPHDVRYDLLEDAETIKRLARRKSPEQIAKPEPKITYVSQDQISQFNTESKQRKLRRKPAILMIEDGDFARKILEGILGRGYDYFRATSSERAIELYVERCPDITFIDHDSKNIDGYALAETITGFDLHSYIVIASNEPTEPGQQIAHENHFHGFILKPYSRQKVSEVLAGYLQRSKA